MVFINSGASIAFALLGRYAAHVGSCLLVFRGSTSVQSSRPKQFNSLEDGTDKLSRNVGTQVSTHAA